MEDKVLHGMYFYMTEPTSKLERKIEKFGGTVLTNIDSVSEGMNAFAVVDNDPYFGVRFAMARAHQLNCVTSEYIHHCCWFKKELHAKLYKPTYYTYDDTRYIFRLSKKALPFEGRNILILSDSVSRAARVIYLLKQSKAHAFYGYDYTQKFEKKKLNIEFDFTICLSKVPDDVMYTLKKMDAQPVNEKWLFDSIITGELVDLFIEGDNYIPENYFDVPEVDY